MSKKRAAAAMQRALDVQRAQEHVKELECHADVHDDDGYFWKDWALREMYYRGLEEARAANGKKGKKPEKVTA